MKFLRREDNRYERLRIKTWHPLTFVERAVSIEDGMESVEKTITVRAPLKAAFDYLSDPYNLITLLLSYLPWGTLGHII